jgi:3-deoxy-7-phosphoheptulonate synthase
MRTSLNSFQGLREDGIALIKELKLTYNFQYASEISSLDQLEKIKDIVDYIQIGARSMYNYELLSSLGKYNKSVILKRGFSATIEEWIKAADYIKQSNPNIDIILCERGVRGFDNKFRNILDIQSALYIKKNTNYKILIDPSHASGLRDYIEDLSVASIALGIDGLMVETHPNPEQALSDKEQAIPLDVLKRLYLRCEKINNA